LVHNLENSRRKCEEGTIEVRVRNLQVLDILAAQVDHVHPTLIVEPFLVSLSLADDANHDIIRLQVQEPLPAQASFPEEQLLVTVEIGMLQKI
jgi:hypothetical protein